MKPMGTLSRLIAIALYSTLCLGTTTPVPPELGPFMPESTSTIICFKDLAGLEKRVLDILNDANPEAAAMISGTIPTTLLESFIVTKGRLELSKPMYVAILAPAKDGVEGVLPDIRLFLQVSGTDSAPSAYPPFASATAIGNSPWIVVATTLELTASKTAASKLMTTMPEGDLTVNISQVPAMVRPALDGALESLPDQLEGIARETLTNSKTLALSLTLQDDTLELTASSRRTEAPAAMTATDAQMRDALGKMLTAGAFAAVAVSPFQANSLLQERLSQNSKQSKPDEILAQITSELLSMARGPVAFGVTAPSAAQPSFTTADSTSGDSPLRYLVTMNIEEATVVTAQIVKAMEAADDAGLLPVTAAGGSSPTSAAWTINRTNGEPPLSFATVARAHAVTMSVAPSAAEARVGAERCSTVPARAIEDAPSGWLDGCFAAARVDLRTASQIQAASDRRAGRTNSYLLLPPGDAVPILGCMRNTRGSASSTATVDLKFRCDIRDVARLIRDTRSVEPWEVLAAARAGDMSRLHRFISLAPGNFELNHVGSGPYDQSPLMSAARGGHIEAMQALLDAGVSTSLTNRSGYSPLMAASESRQPEAVNFLLKLGGDVNTSTTEGRTALFYAVRNCDAPTVKVLLAAGAKITAKIRELPGLKANACNEVRELLNLPLQADS
ncbi:MAG: ankyrin repeat domain-containing protein [Phycisphaerales bacterium]|nr:ankyrin repeat domain-containing protein [Phycisphaerales bacterium]